MLCLTDTSLYIYICVKHFGMARIKKNRKAAFWSIALPVPTRFSRCISVNSLKRFRSLRLRKVLAISAFGSQTRFLSDKDVVDCTLEYYNWCELLGSDYWHLSDKIIRKVKCTLVLRLCTGRTTHRGSRGIALLFLDHGNRRGWGISVAPRPLFTPGKDPVPIVQEAGWALGPVWSGAENLASTGIRSPDCPARSQSLYRLSYPAHWIK